MEEQRAGRGPGAGEKEVVGLGPGSVTCSKNSSMKWSRSTWTTSSSSSLSFAWEAKKGSLCAIPMLPALGSERGSWEGSHTGGQGTKQSQRTLGVLWHRVPEAGYLTAQRTPWRELAKGTVSGVEVVL